ncbi:hypothetical protein GXM_05977 [Nostoc sphaeroides CCNUC1]|uniref:Uncharacterized protein n=1 Tax=Nostoc sphaeroides CCNUC1 TaxID=2653204 RepID=A0A5P8W6T1_9NOSO|nr:hypothetical protein GXM_05977 [Nostoc sphaeroides CCNUC1]
MIGALGKTVLSAELGVKSYSTLCPVPYGVHISRKILYPHFCQSETVTLTDIPPRTEVPG